MFHFTAREKFCLATISFKMKHTYVYSNEQAIQINQQKRLFK